MAMRPGSQACVSYVVAETGSLPILYDAWKGLVAYIVSVKLRCVVHTNSSGKSTLLSCYFWAMTLVVSEHSMAYLQLCNLSKIIPIPNRIGLYLVLWLLQLPTDCWTQGSFHWYTHIVRFRIPMQVCKNEDSTNKFLRSTFSSWSLPRCDPLIGKSCQNFPTWFVTSFLPNVWGLNLYYIQNLLDVCTRLPIARPGTWGMPWLHALRGATATKRWRLRLPHSRGPWEVHPEASFEQKQMWETQRCFKKGSKWVLSNNLFRYIK